MTIPSKLHRIFYRSYHFGLRLAQLIYPIPSPICFEKHQLKEWVNQLSAQNIQRILLVSDPHILNLNLHEEVENVLTQANIEVSIFTGIKPDPDVNDVELGYQLYLSNRCQSIVAIGGGSVIDGAKLIGIRVARPSKPLVKIRRLFGVLRKLPPLTAIPTTAGTGSETTVAAVVSDKRAQLKFALVDYCIAPRYAILIPELTVGLPQQLTATTAFDALTHAIEAYIGINGTKYTDQKALQACELIFTHLPIVIEEPTNIHSRKGLLRASFLAGEAFTRTSVGYVHALAHQLGAKYHTPHGLANSVLLDIVLEEFGDSVTHKLEEIAIYCNLNNNNSKTNIDKSRLLIETIKELKTNAHINNTLDNIDSADFEQLAINAMKEAHPSYPVPKFWEKEQFITVLNQITHK